jgi:site-specific recombinase XerD
MKSRVIKKSFPRIIQTWVNGDKVYQVDCRKEGWGGQKRFNFHSESAARAKAKEIEKIFAEQGAQGAQISLQDRLKVQAALVPLQEFNTEQGSTFSVENAVHFFIRAMHDQKKKRQVPFVYAAVEQFLEAKFDPNGGKGNKQLSRKTLNELKSVAGIIVENWKYKRVNEVTAEMIRCYLNKTKTAKGSYFTNQTKLNRLTKIRQFFNYCMEKPREWLKENPCAGITITAESKEVEILSNEQVITLLEAAIQEKEKVQQVMVPYLVLGLFAGLRPEEAQKMRWEWIEPLDEEKRIAQVKVPAEISKISESRYAELSEAGWSLIKPYFKQDGPIGWSRRAFRRIRDKAGFAGSTWPADCIRHTYASSWLAVHKERAHLAEIMGNSPSIIRKHYKRAIPVNDAEAYFQISLEMICGVKST